MLSLPLLFGCVKVPAGLAPVQDFELDRYLGRWYEIARLDHRFERGLENVSADYSLRPEGGISVTNQGYSAAEDKWKEAVGKAFFVGDEHEAHLKVSFFGPFYSSYIIFELDKKNYTHAFVSGANKSYLWLLARTPEIDESVSARFKARAEALGFDTSALIWVSHDAR
jgi:apolipoprotein D and lipocalin family protein